VTATEPGFHDPDASAQRLRGVHFQPAKGGQFSTGADNRAGSSTIHVSEQESGGSLGSYVLANADESESVTATHIGDK
jgi:hypothetical protein